MRTLIDRLAGLAVVAAAVASVFRGRNSQGLAPTRPTRATIPESRPSPSLLASLRQAITEDDVSTVAAAMVYFGFLALFPALIAVVSIYGLVSDSQAVADQIARLSELLPSGAAAIIEGQLSEIVSASRTGLGIGLVLSLLATLWSVSSGVSALVRGINGIFQQTETRSFIQLRLLSLALTIGLIVFAVAAVFVATALPATLRSIGWESGAVEVVAWTRWIILAGGAVAGLTVFYRVAPNDRRTRRWWSPGAALAAVLWVAATVVLNVYVAGFANYNDTYGALGGVIVLMLWMYVSSFIILLGAEFDAVQEDRSV